MAERIAIIYTLGSVLALAASNSDTTNSQPVEQIVSVQRSVGQRVTFPCTSHNSDNTDWWRYQPGASTAPVAAHQISSAGLIINSFKTDGRFSLRSAFRGDSSLRIRNVNQSDGGVYICRTQHDDYEVQHQFQLTVLPHSENEVLVPVGESVTFNCSASQPVDWFYQRSESSSMQQVSSAGVMVNGFEADGRYTLTPLGGLMIDNITLDNSGFYSCVVSGQGVLLILHLIVQNTITEVDRTLENSLAGVFAFLFFSVEVFVLYQCVTKQPSGKGMNDMHSRYRPALQRTEVRRLRNKSRNVDAHPSVPV